MSILSKVFLAACAVVAVNAQTPNYASFCERYAGGNNATTQRATITAIVSSAVLGEAGSGTGGFPAFTGIVGEPTLKGYFNGSWPAGSTDYLTNTAAYNTLATQLINFFQAGLHCRAAAAAFPFVASGTLAALHAPMYITEAKEALFGMIVGKSAGWHGVPLSAANPPPATSENAYVGAVFAQFGAGGGANAICTETGAGNCPYAPLSEIWTQSSPNAFVVGGVAGAVLTIPQGGNVHWNIGATHNVRQVADGTTVDPMPNGWGTAAGGVGGNGLGLTVNFPTAGTFYYICQPHAAAGMRGSIVVTAPTPSSASTVSVSVLAVAAVAVAAAKLL